jgi:hypothetical protein
VDNHAGTIDFSGFVGILGRITAAIEAHANQVVKGKREIVQKVHALKPRLTKEFIRQSYSELKQMNWV